MRLYLQLTFKQVPTSSLDAGDSFHKRFPNRFIMCHTSPKLKRTRVGHLGAGRVTRFAARRPDLPATLSFTDYCVTLRNHSYEIGLWLTERAGPDH